MIGNYFKSHGFVLNGELLLPVLLAFQMKYSKTVGQKISKNHNGGLVNQLKIDQKSN